MVSVSSQFVTAGIVLSVGGIVAAHSVPLISGVVGSSPNSTYFVTTPPYRSGFIRIDQIGRGTLSLAKADDLKAIVERLTTNSIDLSMAEKKLIRDNLFDLL